jgi:hypothetical protein
MAYKSNILENGKTYDHGLYTKTTYFNVGVADPKDDNNDPTKIPELPAGDSLIITTLRNPWLSVFSLRVIAGANAVANNTVYDFGLYTPQKGTTAAAGVNQWEFISLSAAPLFSVTVTPQVGANTFGVFNVNYHGKLAVSFPDGGVVDGWVTAVATAVSYDASLAYLDRRPEGTTAAEAKAAVVAYLTLDATKNSVFGEVGSWPSRTAAQVKGASDAGVTVVHDAINNLVIAQDETFLEFVVAVQTLYTDNIKNASAAARRSQSGLYVLEEVLKDSALPIYLGMKNHDAGGGIPAQVRFALEYSDTGGSNV